jgi:hypothetical protein
MEDPGPTCLRCVGLDDLEFLPSGDPQLTHRVRSKATRYAAVVRFSRSRRRYDRQGLLVSSRRFWRTRSGRYSDAARCPRA